MTSKEMSHCEFELKSFLTKSSLWPWRMIPPTPTENLFTTPLTLLNPSFSPPVKNIFN
jgi:hypothetical protein